MWNTATLLQVPQQLAPELVPDLFTRNNYTPVKGDVVYFSKSDYIKFLQKAAYLQLYKLSVSDKVLMASEAEFSPFPDPMLVQITKISPFQRITKNVLLIHLEGCAMVMKLNVKYLDIKGISKFLWARQIFRVRI